MRILIKRGKLLYFVNRLGNIYKAVPSDEVEKKCWMHLIDVTMMMESRSREGHWDSLGKFLIFFILHHWLSFIVFVLE